MSSNSRVKQVDLMHAIRGESQRRGDEGNISPARPGPALLGPPLSADGKCECSNATQNSTVEVKRVSHMQCRGRACVREYVRTEYSSFSSRDSSRPISCFQYTVCTVHY